MVLYFFKRLLLVFPTLVGIMLVNFVIVQFVPGGPVEQVIASINNQGVGGSIALLAGDDRGELLKPNEGGANEFNSSGRSRVEEELYQELARYYGLDQPAHHRFFTMMKNYFTFDFGDSFYQDRSVIELVIEKLPVSASLGLWTTLLVYVFSIPLGIYKAVKDGNKFDISSSVVITVAYSIPSFLFAVFLIILFAGGEYFNWFPLKGIVSENFSELSLWEKVLDYFHHLFLPILSMVIGGFASLTFLTKNSFLDQINMQYVITARSKGLKEKDVLYKHVFRNAMLIVIAGFPSALIGILFTSSLLIEVIFSLDGLGLLGFNAALKYDYPIIFGVLFFTSLLGLVLKIVTDISYSIIDPRIDFERREG